MKTLRTILERLEAVWCMMTARNVICARLVYGVVPEEDELTVWRFGRWIPADFEAVGRLAEERQNEELAEELVKELLQ